MKFKLTILFSLFAEILFAQNNPTWDDTVRKNWPAEFEQTEIKSSVDGKMQKVIFRFTKSETPKPLIISLHTWSGDYTQIDPLTTKILKKDWNYIHPNFRGPNKTKEACGSKLVVSDIDDAISYALENANVDTTNIHVIGVSGGGFATMLTYMKSVHNIKTFSSWAGISNMVNWYYESLGRGKKYAGDICLSTTGKITNFNVNEAILRSPFYMKTPVKKRKNSKLFLYCGVHDGYTGSVPISQTIDFYNKVVTNFEEVNTSSKVPAETREIMLRQQNLPGTQIAEKIGDRKIIYRNSFQNKLFLNVFEGEHEMIVDVALSHIPSKNILLIGDSNGAFKHGWANQLKKIMPNNFIVNTSISGNTIGFDNSGYQHLNTLRMVDSYLKKGVDQMQTIDYIVIVLGTNDCKAVFDNRLKEVPKNLKKLIKKIQKSDILPKTPKIIVVTPPPYGDDNILKEKYKGGSERVRFLKTEYSKIAKKTNVAYLDIQTPLEPVFKSLSKDGVHLIKEGQTIIAKLIKQEIVTK
jgi:lysophospholipase L1-like esterase